MATLTGQSIASSYEQLLHVDRDGGGNGTTLVDIKDGDNGTTFALQIATDKIQVNGNATITTADNTDTLTLISTDADENSGPNLRLYRNSASPEDSDVFGQIDFEGRNNNSEDFVGAMIKVASGDVSDGTEDAQIEFDVMTDGTLREYLRMASGSTPAVIFNQDSRDIDFRVLSDNLDPAFFVQGSDGNVGVSSSSPQSKIHIESTTQAPALTIDQSTENYNGGLRIRNNVGGGNDSNWDIYGSGSDLRIAHLTASNSSYPDLNTGFSNYFGITSAGLVGVGTVSPATPLHANSDGSANGIMSNQIVRITPADGNNGLNIGSDGTDAMIGVTNNDTDLHFLSRTGGAYSKAMTIQSDGTANQEGNYTVNEQGRQNHVANTMSSPYYRLDGVNDKIEVADNANLDFATNDFSVEALVRIPSGVAGRTILGKIDHSNAGLEGYSMEVGANGKLAGRIVGNNTRTLISEGSTVIADGNYHHVCITFDRSANATVYVNGVAEGTTDISGSSGDASNSNPFQIGTNDQEANFTEMEISHAKVFNNLLTATEVKELYSGASVPYKYKGASQTATYTSDFTSGADSFVNGARATVTGNSDGVNSVDDTLKIIADSTSNASHYARRNSTTSVRRTYRIKFDYFIPSGQTVDGFQFGFQYTLNQFSTTGSWQTNVSFEVTDSSSGDLFLYLTDGGSQTVAGNAQNEYVAIKNVTVVPIGAVAEYDGSSAGAKVWGDKSGNSLDGTVGAGTLDATAPTLENTPYDAGTEYEEGTFTPAWVAGTGSFSGTITYQNRVGKYVKIGNAVHITISFYNNAFASTGGSGSIKLGGLPYTASAKCALALGDTRLFNDDNPSEAEVGNGTTNVILYIRDGNADVANSELQVADLATGSSIVANLVTLSGTYFT